MSCFDDRVPLRVYQLLLLVSESSPEHEDHAFLRLTTDELDDRISELLPADLRVRIRLMSSNRLLA